MNTMLILQKLVEIVTTDNNDKMQEIKDLIVYMDTCLNSPNLVSYEKEAILAHKHLAVVLLNFYANQ